MEFILVAFAIQLNGLIMRRVAAEDKLTKKWYHTNAAQLWQRKADERKMYENQLQLVF